MVDRTTREDEYFYKTDSEWHEEIRISKYGVRKARKTRGNERSENVCEKANGVPTVHYKLDKSVFRNDDFLLRNRKRKFRNRKMEIAKTNFL